MAKTMIDLDEELLDAARKELGTHSKKDTVNEALKVVANRQQRVRGVIDDAALLAMGVGPDITNPEIMAGARR